MSEAVLKQRRADGTRSKRDSCRRTIRRARRWTARTTRTTITATKPEQPTRPAESGRSITIRNDRQKNHNNPGTHGRVCLHERQAWEHAFYDALRGLTHITHQDYCGRHPAWARWSLRTQQGDPARSEGTKQGATWDSRLQDRDHRNQDQVEHRLDQIKLSARSVKVITMHATAISIPVFATEAPPGREWPLWTLPRNSWSSYYFIRSKQSCFYCKTAKRGRWWTNTIALFVLLSSLCKLNLSAFNSNVYFSIH